MRDLEVRIRRKDGQIRTTLGSAELIEVNGKPCTLSVIADVTERKRAEEALASLSGRLIEAQDEERKRIAREIHDDYNQRVAMLAIDLEQLAENVGDSSGETSQKVHELFDRVSELGADMHSLSHRLHSSTLESLGLLVGLEAFCKEFAEQQGVQVDFVHENVPPWRPSRCRAVYVPHHPGGSAEHKEAQRCQPGRGSAGTARREAPLVSFRSWKGF